jgi:chemotaxis protein CheX
MIDQAELVGQITTSATDVFTTMLAMDVAAQDPFTERDGLKTSDGVLALIGIAGEWVGTAVFHCSPAMARRIYVQFLCPDEEPEMVTDEVLDAVAEVTNMIVGNVKNWLEERLGSLGMSIPTVVFGRNFVTRSAGSGDWVVVPFLCDGEMVSVKVCLTKSREPHPIRHGFVAPVMLSE